LEIRIAKNYGFCFGVKRAIDIAQSAKGGVTYGPLIHNKLEIDRLKSEHNVGVIESTSMIEDGQTVIIRTHGIVKSELDDLKKREINLIDATCPFVTKPQKIVESMSEEGYQVVIFGDEDHPEVKGVKSYSASEPIVILSEKELEDKRLKNRVALVSQTTRKVENFIKIAEYLIRNVPEVRIFNTICNATFDNQESARELSRQSDIMIIIGGKNSSNTKQLLKISQENCESSYLIENSDELEEDWFEEKKICGITAGASTPEWIIQGVIDKISKF